MTSSAPNLHPMQQPHSPRNVIPFLPRRFTATLLLDRPWDVDVAAVAVTTVVRFPMIGRVRPLWGCAPDAPPGIEIDGAKITLRSVPESLQSDLVFPAMLPSGHRHSACSLPRHVSHIDISCGGSLPGVGGARAYAAAAHFVATATCAVAPVCAVFWRTGRVLVTPDSFGLGTGTILGGGVPVDSWVSFAPASSRVSGVSVGTGMRTYGLRPFVGCELELAPGLVSPRVAVSCLSQFARMALNGSSLLNEPDRDELLNSEPMVRVRDCWPLRGLPDYRLIGEDAATAPGSPAPGCRST